MAFEALYGFQLEDYEKLKVMKAALIGSEMGTGKTHVAIALDEYWQSNIKEFKPTLVVAPINTWPSWQEKYEQQTKGGVKVVTIDRKDRNAFVEALKRSRGDVFLCHWEALRLMPELRRFEFGVVIADEVHRASNRKAQATRALKKLRCTYKLALSGTASGNNPDNLWSILNWLWPTYYTSYWAFRKFYCVEEMQYINGGQAGYSKIVGVQNTDHLQGEMEKWYVRHLKRERCCIHHPNGVMDYLPEKTYDHLWVDLSPVQRRVYEEMRTQMVAWVNEHQETPLVASVVVAQMVRLSQIALATPLIVPTSTVMLSMPSSKIDAVKELITDAEPNKKFVVFSSSKKACYLFAEEMARIGIAAEVLSGDTPQSERQTLVQRFVDGDFRIFVGVIAAAAEGIDGLQYATDTAIFLDRSWSTLQNEQAEARLHREGQKDTVLIIDVMARNTLDFGRKQKLEKRWAWLKQILGDSNYSYQQLLTTEDDLEVATP